MVVVLDQKLRCPLQRGVVLVVVEHILMWMVMLLFLLQLFLHQQHHIKMMVEIMEALEL